MRRKIIAAFTFATMTALMVSAPAFAHVGHGNPCDETAPGHSAYAKHHIVPSAQEQSLGPEHGHAPGSHQGYAGLCG